MLIFFINELRDHHNELWDGIFSSLFIRDERKLMNNNNNNNDFSTTLTEFPK